MASTNAHSAARWLSIAGLAVGLLWSPAQADTASEPQTDAPKHIVAVGADVTATVLALDAGNQLAAIDSTSATLTGTKDLPVVGYMRTLAPEGILALSPDLVLATEGSGPAATLDQLQASGVKVVSIETEATLEGAQEKVRQIGDVLQRSAAAQTLIERMQNNAQTLQNALATYKDTPKVIFILSAGRGAPLVSGAGTMADAMIRLAGAENAMGTVEGYKPMGLETAIAAQPDVVMTTQQTMDMMGGPEEILTLPIFAGMTDQPKLVAIDGADLIGFGPNTAQVALALAADLHGEPTP